jgi:hypothetical protein
MTVCDLGCASSEVGAERFRTIAKSFTAGAHTPAVRRGHRLDADEDTSGADLGILRSGKSARLTAAESWQTRALAGWWLVSCSYFKMLTARATTSTPMLRDTTASIIISSLAHRLIAEMSVGLNAVAVQKASDR